MTNNSPKAADLNPNTIATVEFHWDANDQLVVDEPDPVADAYDAYLAGDVSEEEFFELTQSYPGPVD